MNTEVTPIIFRKWKGGEVIALFFEDLGTDNPYTCSSYIHIGQHGSANPWLVINSTKPAKPADYADLAHELESEPYGYKLKIYKRMPWTSVDVRRGKLQAMNGRI